MKNIRIACAGEVIVEIAATECGENGAYQQVLAGDSFNSAIDLARAGLAVEYVSCLGG